RGYPRYSPGDDGRARLARGEVDAMIIVGSATSIPAPVQALIATVPHAIIGPHATDGPLSGAVAAIDTGMPGVHESGTALRMDDIPLPLGAPLNGPTTTADLLARLARA